MLKKNMVLEKECLQETDAKFYPAGDKRAERKSATNSLTTDTTNLN